MTYAEFEQLLAVYGSDRSRWPLEARTSASQLVARNRDAQRLLAETEALDRVLDRAPMPTLAREAPLASRIVAGAQRSPRVVSVQSRDESPVRAGPVVVSKAIAEPESTPSNVNDSMFRWRDPLQMRRPWRMGIGAAVASLIAGVLIGMTNLPQPVLRPVQQLTGLSLTNGTSTVASGYDPLDEDLL